MFLHQLEHVIRMGSGPTHLLLAAALTRQVQGAALSGMRVGMSGGDPKQVGHVSASFDATSLGGKPLPRGEKPFPVFVQITDHSCYAVNQTGSRRPVKFRRCFRDGEDAHGHVKGAALLQVNS